MRILNNCWITIRYMILLTCNFSREYELYIISFFSLWPFNSRFLQNILIKLICNFNLIKCQLCSWTCAPPAGGKKAESGQFHSPRKIVYPAESKLVFGIFVKKCSNFVQKTPPIFRIRILGDCCLSPPNENGISPHCLPIVFKTWGNRVRRK